MFGLEVDSSDAKEKAKIVAKIVLVCGVFSSILHFVLNDLSKPGNVENRDFVSAAKVGALYMAAASLVFSAGFFIKKNTEQDSLLTVSSSATNSESFASRCSAFFFYCCNSMVESGSPGVITPILLSRRMPPV